MLFNSLDFLIFFPVVVLVYFVLPYRVRNMWLLVASYYFYMGWDPKYALLIAVSTATTWGTGLLLEWFGRDDSTGLQRKLLLAVCLVFNLGILFFFKYYDFAITNLGTVFRPLGISFRAPAFDVVLPVGISFYTFQALGYVIDVYRGEMKAEKSLWRYALFISFFPQLVAGPIERSKNLMGQIYERHSFDAKRVRDGLLLMGWGFFEKLVLADRIAILVTEVFDNYTNHTGLEIVLATVLFAFQIYCDFGGYADIAIGAARVMGFRLMKNFNSPYYAVTVSDFWRNWHISLTTWFRDYVYIPLGGNRCSRWKWCRNLLVTFSLSGLWHGASWNFVVWGGLNGFYQVIGKLTEPFRTVAKKRLGVRTDCASYRFFQRVITFILVDFAWLFFRAKGFMAAFRMIEQGVSNFGLFSLLDSQTLMGLSTIGMDEKDFYVMLIGLTVLGLVDYFRQRVDLKAALDRQNLVFRYFVYYIMIFTVLIFGIYGPEYDASAFIYFQF